MASVVGPDILISNSSGLLAGVEIKNREDLTSQMATVLRRNMVAHMRLPPLPYLMLISQERGYLWTSRTNAVDQIPPDFQFAMADTVAKLLGDAKVEGRLRDRELELLIEYWISSLAHADLTNLTEAEKALQQSGLLTAIKAGIMTARVTRESA